MRNLSITSPTCRGPVKALTNYKYGFGKFLGYIYCIIRIFGKDMNRRDSNKLSSFVWFVQHVLVLVSDLQSCVTDSTWCVCLRTRKNSRRFVTSRVLQHTRRPITQLFAQNNLFFFIYDPFLNFNPKSKTRFWILILYY